MSWPAPFTEGEEVLVGGGAGEGRTFFGVVVEVDEDEAQCLVRFGDCTEQWSDFGRLRRLDDALGPDGDDDGRSASDSDAPPDLGPPEVDVSAFRPPPQLSAPATRSVTPSVSSSSVAAMEDVDDVEDLDDDEDAFREEFRLDEIDDEEEDDDVPLNLLQKRKRKSRGANSSSSAKPPKVAKRTRRGGGRRPRPRPAPIVATPEVLEARKELPYDFESLVWDASHLRNDTERYCYCGESGDWYKKMLQCSNCLQWFHQECLRISTPNSMLFGDRFFHFVCALCSGKSGESLKRLNMNWVEALHLVLFNLTVVNNKKYHDLESSVLPFFRRKWKCLQNTGSHLKSSRLDVDFMTDLLLKNKTRFKCGSEIKKRSTFWGLRKVAPPSVPSRFGLYLQPSSTSSSPAASVVNGKQGGTTALVNHKRKLDGGQRQRQKMLQNATPKVVLNQKGISVMPRPDINLLKKPPVAKKRGRPPRAQQQAQKAKLLRRGDSVDQSEQSDGAETTASSGRGTLEAIIPTPKNFEGFNNPFRNLGIGGAATPAPSSGVASTKTSPGIDVDSANTGTSASGLLMIHDPSKALPKVLLEAAAKPECPDGSSTGEAPSDLKADIKSYFGAFDRMGRGERFSVAARRLNMDGDVQYLVEWEQPNPLSPMVSPASVKSAASPCKKDEPEINKPAVSPKTTNTASLQSKSVANEDDDEDDIPLVIDLQPPKKEDAEPKSPSVSSKKPFPVVIQLRSPVKSEVKSNAKKLPSPNVARKSASVTSPPKLPSVSRERVAVKPLSVIEVIPVKRKVLKVDVGDLNGTSIKCAKIENPKLLTPPSGSPGEKKDVAEREAIQRTEMSLQDKIKDFKSSLEKVKGMRKTVEEVSDKNSPSAEKTDGSRSPVVTKDNKTSSSSVTKGLPSKEAISTPDLLCPKTADVSLSPQESKLTLSSDHDAEKSDSSKVMVKPILLECRDDPKKVSHATKEKEEPNVERQQYGSEKGKEHCVIDVPEKSEKLPPLESCSDSPATVSSAKESEDKNTKDEANLKGETQSADLPKESEAKGDHIPPSDSKGKKDHIPPSDSKGQEDHIPPSDSKGKEAETEPSASIPTSMFYSKTKEKKPDSPPVTVIPVATSSLTLEKVTEELPEDILADSPGENNTASDKSDIKDIRDSDVAAVGNPDGAADATAGDSEQAQSPLKISDVKGSVEMPAESDSASVNGVDVDAKEEQEEKTQTCDASHGELPSDSVQTSGESTVPSAMSAAEKPSTESVSASSKEDSSERANDANCLMSNGNEAENNKTESDEPVNGASPPPLEHVLNGNVSCKEGEELQLNSAAASPTVTPSDPSTQSLTPSGPVVQPNKVALLKVLKQQRVTNAKVLGSNTPVIVIQLQKQPAALDEKS